MQNLRFTIFLLVLFFMHLLFYQYLSIGKVYPDFFLVLVVYAGLRTGPVGGTLTGFLCGMVQDSFSFTYFGLHAVTKTILGFAIGKVRHSFFSNRYIVQAAIIFASKIIHDAIFYLIYLFRGPESFWYQIFFNSSRSALLTCFFGVAVYALFGFRTKAKSW